MKFISDFRRSYGLRRYYLALLLLSIQCHAFAAHLNPSASHINKDPNDKLLSKETDIVGSAKTAHRIVAAGHLSREVSLRKKRSITPFEFAETKLSPISDDNQSIVSFRNFASNRSANNPRLDLFGSFSGDAKKNVHHLIADNAIVDSQILLGTLISAHRIVAAGHLSVEISEKKKRSTPPGKFDESKSSKDSDDNQSIVSFRKFAGNRSANNPGLDLFGSFSSNGKKNRHNLIADNAIVDSQILLGTLVPAHRIVAAGHLSVEISEKKKQSVMPFGFASIKGSQISDDNQSIVSFRKFAGNRSANNPRLDLFGSFSGNGKKNRNTFRNFTGNRSANNPRLDLFGSFFGNEKKNRNTFTNFTDNESANNPGLDLFGSFSGNGKKNIIPITGTVTDSHGPLSGVTVSIEGKNTTTLTDNQGHYTINADNGDTLIFSYVGYKTMVMLVDGRTSLNVNLPDDATTLKEVTVNAGYYTVKDKERTGSIAKITAKDIDKQPVTNVLASMQGRMAGVNIIQDGGTPGGGFTIKIRGRNSLRNDGNEPLYVIDGVPYSNDPIGSPATSTAMASQASPLNSINPGDIESIEVLKDADATAIYGSRGANGVVLITTKKGKGGKTNFSVTASSGAGSATRFVKLMDTQQYLAMRQRGFLNDGINPGDSDYDVNGTWSQSRYTNWQQKLLGGTAAINDLKATISGGSEGTQYLIGANYRTEGTVLPGDFRYNKGGAHVSLSSTSPDKRFKISFSGSYTAQDNLQGATDLTLTARYLAPNAPALYDANGNLNWESDTFDNPLATLRSTYRAKTNDLMANTLLSYVILPGLELKSSFGFTDLKITEQRIVPSTIYNPVYEVGSDNSALHMNLTQRQSWIVEPQLRWFHGFGSHKFDVLAGMTAQQQKSDRLFQSGIGFANNNLIYNFASAITKTVLNSDTFLYRYQAFFGRFNYTYKDKYIVNITGRRDGSSRFGPGRQYAGFGAVGAAWVFSNESFIPQDKVLSFGKLRVSYGLTGNDQIGDYQFYDTYASTGGNYQGVIGLQPSRLYNANFGWETNRKLEVALETGFFKDRVFLTAAWYRNRSSDQLVGVPMPATTGFTSLTANLGATVQNSGLEFTLRTNNIDRGSFKWTTNFNISAAKNKLISFPGLAASTYSSRYVVGQSLDIVKTYHSLGVDPQTGLYTFEDVNGDGAITSADKQAVKDLSPKYFGGLQNQLQYKNWNLDFLLQFVKRDNYAYISNVPGGEPYNQAAGMANSWQQAGSQAPYQMDTSGLNNDAVTAYYNYVESDAVITDGSYIRLKNIALSYDVPLNPKSGIRCRLFVQGQDVLTFTPYKGGDPEFKFSGFLPPLRVYSAGMSLNF